MKLRGVRRGKMERREREKERAESRGREDKAQILVSPAFALAGGERRALRRYVVPTPSLHHRRYTKRWRPEV